MPTLTRPHRSRLQWVSLLKRDEEEESPTSPLSAFPSPPGVPNMNQTVYTQAPSPQATPPVSPLPPQQLTFNRRSLFLPHPNAPKAPLSSSGPLYGRQQPPSQPPPQDPEALHRRSAIYILRQAAAARHERTRNARPITIYGQCETDLCQATGPVPIAFSLDPPPPIPVNIDTKPIALGSSPRVASPLNSTSIVAPEPRRAVLPRANFFPHVQTTRPRSRSFSAFDSQVPLLPMFDGNR